MPNSTDYLLPPPRTVPLLDQLALLCSGMRALIGWIFFGLGLLLFSLPADASFLITEAPFAALLLLLFPLSGAALVFSSLRYNFRLIKLLQEGQLSQGVLKNKEATSTEINEQKVYEYTFDFRYLERSFTAKGRTHKTSLLEDEVHEHILFLPSEPSYNMVYDAYPYAPKISNQGHYERLPLPAYRNLGLVVLFMLINGLLFANLHL